MLCPGSEARNRSEALKIGQFALVSYIPDPLAHFLDDLRLQLTPNCNPHAHVTVLPPRPVTEDLKEAIHRLAVHCGQSSPFEITLGDVEIFPLSHVIFVGLRQGITQLRALYGSLNAGPLFYREPFPYHPHITIAQNMEEGNVREAAAAAKARWAEYRGPRTFRVDSLSFVQQVAADTWVDLAELPLLQTVPDEVSI